VFRLAPHDPAHLHDLLADWRQRPLSYLPIGCTRSPQPVPGFWRDETSVQLGRGEALYRAAAERANRAEFYPGSMAELHAPQRPLEAGDTLVVVYRVPILPLWIVMPTRVIYRFDDAESSPDGTRHQCGFAYGTVTGHPEAGEERFEVSWNEQTDEVWFRILVIARPAWLLAWLGFPFTRREQFRFRRLATHRMRDLLSDVEGIVRRDHCLGHGFRSRRLTSDF
jgi:uncharacterized protein (UPF0548 family)